MLVGLCLLIIYLLNIGMKNLETKHKNEKTKNESLITFVSFVCAIVIVVINKSLIWVVRFLSIREKHETVTAYNLSCSIKLTLARFINTAIVPVIINVTTDKWFNEGGLMP